MAKVLDDGSIVNGGILNRSFRLWVCAAHRKRVIAWHSPHERNVATLQPALRCGFSAGEVDPHVPGSDIGFASRIAALRERSREDATDVRLLKQRMANATQAVIVDVI
jgi:hypothetical protein